MPPVAVAERASEAGCCPRAPDGHGRELHMHAGRCFIVDVDVLVLILVLVEPQGALPSVLVLLA